MAYPLLFALFFAVVSLSGVFLLNIAWVRKNVKYLLSLSAGALLADAFLHLIPHAIEHEGSFEIKLSLTFLAAIVFSFVIESILRYRECCEVETCEDKECHEHRNKKSLGVMNLFGDSWCNFTDGIALAVAFLVSPVAGFATGVAIFLHELPQEIADFGTLVHAGFDKKKAIIANLLVSLLAFVGVFFGYYVISTYDWLEPYLVMFASGSITYLALSDLIPEVHTFHKKGFNWLSLFFLLFGIGALYLIAAYEDSFAFLTH